MVFNSFEFVFFFVVVYGIYRCLNHRAQNLFLLAASYFFYGSWDWRFLFLLLFTTVVDYVCAKKISSASDTKIRKSWLILSVGVNLSVLGFFKYFNFFADNLTVLFKTFGLSMDPFVLKVILPVGVSFYTFQSISYIVDVYNNRVKAEQDFWIYALFVAFFPQLVAGPIERAGHMLVQYHTPRAITPQKNREGVWCLIWGFFLKIFMADNMAKLAGTVFDQKGIIPGGEVLLGSYAFAFQILGDFAGYSFIAMGIARLLGFELMTNFLYPYFVANPRGFWRNWHISLSLWLRDYLYIPMGGSRGETWKTYRNLMVTMFLGGLWHGASWTFAIWGVYQGALLCIHRWVRGGKENPSQQSSVWIHVLKVIGMFQLTCLGWLIFRARTFAHLEDLLKSLILNFAAPSLKVPYLAGQILFFAWLALVIQYLQKKKGSVMLFSDFRGAWPWILFAVMFYLFILFGEFGGQEFIYFQF